eukprot:CAMPEP_0172360760 /NCGR_PEP_ID=MMETSP1060-20121228/4730_1 /TAXON_ID=37318 /ORGANISM="Pseudo-nitzschia pungens, Strain cf. cingulata" /LENGTH=732 /DNA_ID=CAMNT_0013082837 /DNA_START=1 /DNA_END=2199 /DNA_ORIENTATION=+
MTTDLEERRALYDETLGKSTSTKARTKVSSTSSVAAKKEKDRKKKRTKALASDPLIETLVDKRTQSVRSRTNTTADGSVAQSIDRASKKSASKGKKRKKKTKRISQDQQDQLTTTSTNLLLGTPSSERKFKLSVKKYDLERLGPNRSQRSQSKRVGFDGAINSLSPIVSARSNTNGSNQSTCSGSFQSVDSSVQSSLSNDRNRKHKHLIKRKQKIMNHSKNMESKNVDAEASGFLNSNPEEPIERSLNVPDDEVSPSLSTSRKKIIWISIICLVILAAGVTIPCLLLLGGLDGSSNNFPTLSKVGSNEVVASISDDICNEDVPRSGLCSLTDAGTEKQGGDLCNLLAKSMINTTVFGDIALINAGLCQDHLILPEITAGNIKEVIVPENLVAVEISGIDLTRVLTQAMTSSFGSSGNPRAYPYAAGLRYNVEANLPPSERVSDIEVIRGLRQDSWEPIDLRKFYTVITTESLASGAYGYEAFADVIDDWKDALNINTGDAFYNYAVTHGEDPEWSLIPDDEYSTQRFVAEGEEARLGSVPSLMCHALIPGSPSSPSCRAADVVNGGQVCNFVSWAIYDQNLNADVVMLKGSTCAGDIEDGYLVESKIDKALSENESLVTVDLLGSEIVALLQGLVSSGDNGSYPYAAGMRFDVNKNSSPSVSNIQVLTSNGSWTPIVLAATYTVATTSKLGSFSSVSQSMSKTLKDDIISFAQEWKSIYSPPAAKSSTQSYV